MNKSRAINLVLLIALCVPTAGVAQIATGDPDNWCRNGAFPAEEPDFKLASVVGAKNAKIHFLGDDGDCPKPDDVKCIKKSYVIAGDQVLVSRRFGNWMCGWYQPQRGHETVGWLPIGNLTIYEPDANPALNTWVGTWKFYDQSLRIRSDDKMGLLSVKGNAIWHGLGDNVHIGSIDAKSKPKGNKLMLNEGECRVSLKLVGHFIVASDNSQCGGMNVRFNGVYRRNKYSERRRLTTR